MKYYDEPIPVTVCLDWSGGLKVACLAIAKREVSLEPNAQGQQRSEFRFLVTRKDDLEPFWVRQGQIWADGDRFIWDTGG